MIDPFEIKNNNTVELIGIYGDDMTHALSAWTSTTRDLDSDKINRVGKLLSYLAKNKHETPFEKSSIHFLATMDIATHIHLIKHRIGVSVNAESARYKELIEDKAYLPVDWSNDERKRLYDFQLKSFEEYHNCLSRLIHSGMDRKRAKESARFYLPYSNQITCDVMFNFRSFYNFLKLRYSDHAQLEVREFAKECLELVINSGKFPLTLEAFELVIDGKMVNPFK